MDRRRNDIERYLRGEMTAAEMHALEREAMKDPFLAEALEGIEETGAETFLFDLRELHHTVHQRTRKSRPKFISMWNWSIGIAAGLVVTTLAAVYIIYGVQTERETLSMKSPEQPAPPVAQENANAETPGEKPMPDVAASRDTVLPSARADSPAPEEEHAQPAAEMDDTLITPPIHARGYELAIPDTTRMIAGRVFSSEDGAALPGVTIAIPGSGITTSTDASGNYTIPLIKPEQQLVFGFIGMENKTVVPGNQLRLDVTLNPDLSQLSEVVVIDYADTDSAHQCAEPAGGQPALAKYFEERMHYPEQAIANKVEGKVTIEFTVGPDGVLRDFHVLKGIGFGCDDEAIRLLREGPAWAPSKRGREPIAEKVTVQLKFSLPGKQ